MTDEAPFSPGKLAAMREEIRRDGLLADRFLASDSDVPVFGLNLACAWPFPEAWRERYEAMAQKLSALGPEVYVYPFACTHITLVTLISFARHVRPTVTQVEFLRERIPEIIAALKPLCAEDSPERIRSFTLNSQTPILARGAGLLPMLNPDGEVTRLRRDVVELLRTNKPLHRKLTEGGFNVPSIIHSTVLRLYQSPPELKRFLSHFDQISLETAFPRLEVKEILLTSETMPYMRRGEVLQRFKLATG